MLDETLDADNPEVIELNSKTLDEFIGPCAADLKEIWNVLSISSTTRPANQVAAYYPINAFLHFLDDEYYVQGGTGRLTSTLHERLGSKVETGAEVQEVTTEQGKVKVTYMKAEALQTVLAEQCVIGVPAPIALKIVRSLPAWKRDALSRVEFGPGTTAAFSTSEPAERFLGHGVWRVPVSGRSFSSMTNPTITFSGDIKRRHGGIVRVFALGSESRALMTMSDGEALEMLTGDLIATLPDLRGKITDSAIWHWPLALSTWLPGHINLLPALQAPANNIYYCGDYTISAGMEAAVESAYRVADAIDRMPVGITHSGPGNMS